MRCALKPNDDGDVDVYVDVDVDIDIGVDVDVNVGVILHFMFNISRALCSRDNSVSKVVIHFTFPLKKITIALFNII